VSGFSLLSFSKWIATAMLCWLCLLPSIAQEKDSTERKVKVLPFPTLGYEPETKFHFGAVALFTLDLYQDSMTRTSNAKIEFNYTLRNQIILESEWNYFFKEEQWFSQGLLHFSRYPDLYYGVGPSTETSAELLFESNRVNLRGGLYRKIGNHLFTGGALRYTNYSRVISDSLITFNELRQRENLGISGALFYDHRNNLLNASTGAYFRTDLEYNLSNTDYTLLSIDLRKYHTFKYGFVLAGRMYNRFAFGTPTFYDYSVLGGDDYVRGYFYGRYRDKHLSTLQIEMRTPLLWRVGLALISGVSSLYPDPAAFGAVIRPNYGAGIRFLVDKKDNINLRFDYVVGNDQNSGFYISFGESF
tara:strand:+ start:57330 stop:58406 length:1077 start_codon:yes stop_codon:yes gene_type:complete